MKQDWIMIVNIVCGTRGIKADKAVTERSKERCSCTDSALIGTTLDFVSTEPCCEVQCYI